MRAWNLQRALMDERENTVDLFPCKRFQQRADLRRAALKVLDKILQVVDQMLLIGNELRRFHLFFRVRTVKFPQVILMILAKTAEILLQLLPPFPDLFQGHPFQMFSRMQSRLETAERAGGKSCRPRIQVFQRDCHTLHFQRGFRHHVLKLSVFKIRDRVCLVGVLNRSQVFPFCQLIQV